MSHHDVMGHDAYCKMVRDALETKRIRELQRKIEQDAYIRKLYEIQEASDKLLCTAQSKVLACVL